MSADNSPESGSSQTRARANSRYDRAAQTAAVTPLDKQRKQSTDATRTQAAQDRDARAADRAKQRGKAAEIDDVAALFGAPSQTGTGHPSRAAGDRPRAAAQDDDAEDAGRGASSTDAPKPPRPALEFDDDDVDEDQPKRRKKANALEAFAEAHELEAKVIYDLEISLEEGEEPVTIGKLKDHFKETRDLEKRRDEFEDWQASSQNEIIQSRTQIENVMQRLTQVVPPEAMARAIADMQDDFAAKAEKARGQIREWFPEWSDVQRKVEDRGKLETALASYGFSKFEVGAVSDARLIKFAMDAVRLMERHKRLRDGYERDKKPSKEATSQRKERRQSATDRANAIAAKGDKVGAVASLIGG